MLLNPPPDLPMLSTTSSLPMQSARRKEKEEAAAFKEGRKTATGVAVIGSTTVRVDDKYKHMLVAQAEAKKVEGAADDAWDD